jgi:hypothetical protein
VRNEPFNGLQRATHLHQNGAPCGASPVGVSGLGRSVPVRLAQPTVAKLGRAHGQPIWGDDVYAPTWDDFFLFAASAGALLGGLGGLGMLGGYEVKALRGKSRQNRRAD